jgi:hypothetical protein
MALQQTHMVMLQIMHLNDDSLVNVQDIILAVNLILNSEYNNLADLNSDGNIDILDIVQLVNIILTSITRTTYPA